MHQLLPSINLQSFIIIKYSSTHALPLFHTAFLAALCFFDATSYNFFCFFCSSFSFFSLSFLFSPSLSLASSSAFAFFSCSSTHVLFHCALPPMYFVPKGSFGQPAGRGMLLLFLLQYYLILITVTNWIDWLSC